ncbi:TetR/AcrR family transcriptional regulator [Pontibacter sp. E15-1]|uniref:TetR/AcrR family transcriptional regulator n=1 Tax=Pontibacter sp. E15-1 TaxID=2919918 RepID=UPI001F4FD85E|nr:TetR/AcrR family transcriptional regulator [Pontibacter sp. E15-1]MCJ8166294.1 TetR/AcrR family transcriptional regulator [Pontibacter sp. E15-1]
MEALAEKKKAILESTLQLIQEHGFHGTPMSMVAKKAGVAAGTIYHYFESKERLICELYSHVKQQSLEAMQHADDQALPYQQRFFALWHSLFDFYRDNPSVLIFFEQFVNSPYYTQKPLDPLDAFHKTMRQFFEEGVQQHHLREANPEILAMVVHGSIITTAKVHRHKKLQFGGNDLQQIAQIMWDGMAAR